MLLKEFFNAVTAALKAASFFFVSVTAAALSIAAMNLFPGPCISISVSPFGHFVMYSNIL